MAFKSFKNNGVLIKPELTDDWVMSFEYGGGMKVSSKKLDVSISISNSNVKFFMDKLIRMNVKTEGGKIIGNYLIQNDLSLVDENTVIRSQEIGFEVGYEYALNQFDKFTYLGEFYIIEDTSKNNFKLPKPKKVKIGVICDCPDSDESFPLKYRYFILQVQSATDPLRRVDDYGKFLVDIEKKCLINGFYYIGRGKPRNIFSTTESCRGKEAIEVEIDQDKYIITRPQFNLTNNNFHTNFKYLIRTGQHPAELLDNRIVDLLIVKNNKEKSIVKYYIDKSSRELVIDSISSVEGDSLTNEEEIKNVISQSGGKEIRNLIVI